MPSSSAVEEQVALNQTGSDLPAGTVAVAAAAAAYGEAAGCVKVVVEPLTVQAELEPASELPSVVVDSSLLADVVSVLASCWPIAQELASACDRAYSEVAPVDFGPAAAPSDSVARILLDHQVAAMAVVGSLGQSFVLAASCSCFAVCCLVDHLVPSC